MVEDTTEIILNLKGLALKLHGDGPKIVRTEAEGEGEVTAADMTTGGEVEILNPELHIATLEKADVYMEMSVEKGRGYVSAEKKNKREDQPIGTIQWIPCFHCAQGEL